MAGFSIAVDDLNERVFLEQALEFFRNLRSTCEAAPHGQVLAQAEQAALLGGRELIRQGFQTLLNEQGHAVQKKGRPKEPARTVMGRGGIADCGPAGT
jgi:hypothetical protein